jgi:vanillin dehydrogenase
LRQPAGVVVGMAPWNAPVILGVRAIAVPLAVGNTVVLKASELSPATHRLIVDAFVEAGLPAGVVNFISHAAADAPAVVEALISHPATRRVNFTGSSRVGRIIGEMSGKYLKPCLLELGGKAPLVVLEDADLDQAVAAAAFGAFMHQGQICMSTERIIVVDKVYDQFMKKFIAKTRSLAVGDPTKGNFPIGACVDAKTVDHVKALIEDATARGGKVATGGTGGGAFFEPTVIEGVKKDMRIYGEESFGPIVGVIRAGNADDAVAIANDCEYGLSAAVFSQDINAALAVAQRIDSGICHINSPTVQDEAQMPFGGTKSSGLGRFGGKAGIAEFTDLRWISIATQHRHYPI